MTRFVAPALPALWILAAATLRRGERKPLSKRVQVVLVVLCVSWFTTRFVNVEKDVQREYEFGTEVVPYHDFVARNIEGPASVLVVNYTDLTSARTLVWTLATATDEPRYHEFDVKGLIAERIFESPKRLHSWMTKERPWGDERWNSYVIELFPGPSYPQHGILVPETVEMWRAAVAHYDGRLENVATARFADLDLKVTVWRDRQPPKHVGH